MGGENGAWKKAWNRWTDVMDEGVEWKEGCIIVGKDRMGDGKSVQKKKIRKTGKVDKDVGWEEGTEQMMGRVLGRMEG